MILWLALFAGVVLTSVPSLRAYNSARWAGRMRQRQALIGLLLDLSRGRQASHSV